MNVEAVSIPFVRRLNLSCSGHLALLGLSLIGQSGGSVFSIVDPAHPDRVKVGEVEGWQVQEVDVLAYAKNYSDPLSAKVAKWDEGRFALAKAREIAEDFELVDGKVPARVRAAGRACLPISDGHLHPVARAISPDKSRAIALFAALAYKGASRGFEKGVLVAFEAREVDGEVECALVGEAEYRVGMLRELMSRVESWKSGPGEAYLDLAGPGLPTDGDGGVAPGRTMEEAWEEWDRLSQLDFDARALWPVLNQTPPELVAALEAGGKEAWLNLVDDWIAKKQKALEYYLEHDDAERVEVARSTMFAMKFDRMLYAKGMKPPERFCAGVAPWWQGGADKEAWWRGEAFEFYWQAMGYEVYEPYLTFDPDSAPLELPDLAVVQRFLMAMESEDYDQARAQLAEGQNLSALFFNSPNNPDSTFELLPFGSSEPRFEVLGRSEFILEDARISEFLLQRRSGDPATGWMAGLPIRLQLIWTEEGWKVFDGLRYTHGVSIMDGAICGRWHGVWQLDSDGKYRFARRPEEHPFPYPDSSTYTTILRPFLNPSLRE